VHYNLKPHLGKVVLAQFNYNRKAQTHKIIATQHNHALWREAQWLAVIYKNNKT
jgi:hypothetical protein